jgi:hypothetical protein
VLSNKVSSLFCLDTSNVWESIWNVHQHVSFLYKLNIASTSLLTLELSHPSSEALLDGRFDKYLDDYMAIASLPTKGLEEPSRTKTTNQQMLSQEHDLFSYWTSPSSATYESTVAVVEEGVIVDKFPPILVCRLWSCVGKLWVGSIWLIVNPTPKIMTNQTSH